MRPERSLRRAAALRCTGRRRAGCREKVEGEDDEDHRDHGEHEPGVEGDDVDVLGLDAATGATRWEYVAPRRQTDLDGSYGGVLSTAGGIALSASSGVLFALDLATGQELWRASLGGRMQATPISFLVDGSQVIAVAAGRSFFVFGL